ncbi:MAG: hypothetical protein ACYSW3_28195, partial [Planctomycetota bacterium]
SPFRHLWPNENSGSRNKQLKSSRIKHSPTCFHNRTIYPIKPGMSRIKDANPDFIGNTALKLDTQ